MPLAPDFMLEASTVALLKQRAGKGPILVALSGGGDSVALLHVLAGCVGSKRLRAVIVDHRLREGSARDAERARQIARSLDVAVRLQELSWPEDAGRGHDAARALRYTALFGEAREHGARIIATGHTRDDQAETVFMRAARGSGLRGLAGMRAFAPAPLWPEGRGLVLARPLLAARRAALRAELEARGAAWIEDPANEDERFARVRARRLLAQFEREGLDPMRFAVLADRLQSHVEATDRQAAALIADTALFREDEIVLQRSRWAGPRSVRVRALEAVIIAASGARRGPAGPGIELIDAALVKGDFDGATLGGAWLQQRGLHIIVRRDPGALFGRAGGVPPIAPLALPPQVQTVWDGRVALTMPSPGWSVVFEGSAPLLRQGEERRPLAAASPQWLLKERVQHILGQC